jgi:hypothetical protein
MIGGEVPEMHDQTETLVPPYLIDLLEPTPSGTAKVIAAWDGLAPETQILLLSERSKRPGRGHLYHRIIRTALKSRNAYVRYLAAKEAQIGAYGQEITDVESQIAADAEPLVKYALLESDWCALDQQMKDPEAFFALPQEARLAKVRRLTGDGEVLANLISYAAEHYLKDGRISESDIFDILTDYLIKPKSKHRYADDLPNYDGWRSFRNREDLCALWRLVLKIPERLSHVLIENLPLIERREIPNEVVERMSDHQLATLLDRRDVGLTDLRRKIFLAEEEGDGGHLAKDQLRNAAIFVNFDPTNEEFARVLARPDKQRVRDLSSLAIMAQDMRLCIYEAVHDALLASEVGLFDFQNAEFAKRSFLQRLEQLAEWRREKELLELKLYRLAVFAVPWKTAESGCPLWGELTFLNEAAVKGDTFATFMAFWKKWGEVQVRGTRLEDHLPRIWEAGEEDAQPNYREEVDESEQMADRIACRLSDLLKKAPHMPKDTSPEPVMEMGDQPSFAEKAVTAQEKTFGAVNSLQAQLCEIRRSGYRQLLSSWTIIALLLVLVFLGK